MISILFLIVFSISLISADWVQVWEDNFDGNAINTDNWKYETGGGGWGNNELQYYTDGQNVKVQNGNLILDVKVENKDNNQYTSTRLNSKSAWTYGKFEASAKLPKGKNLWPAIWLFPQSTTYGTWAASGEIDIMEYRGERENEVQGTLHYGAQWPNNQHSGSGEKPFPGTDFSSDFHLFGCEWNSTSITWSVDSKPYHTENIDRNMSSGAPYTKNGQPFDKPFFWILNVAVSGAFFPTSVYGPAVTVDEAKQWAKPSLEIDFIRVSQWK